MTPEVKERIEKIRHGNVPDGYKKVGSDIIPVDWSKVAFGDLGVIASGLVDPKTEPYLHMQHIGPDNIEKHTGRILDTQSAAELGLISGKFYFASDSIVYSKIRPNLNKVCTPSFEGICSADCYSIKPTKKVDKVYLFNLMLGHSFYKRAVACSMRTGMPKINQDDLNIIPMYCPTDIAEQTKIAEILTAQDKVIELKEKRLAEKRRQKKYLMQQLLTGKKRLPGFDGEWKAVKLSEVLLERKEKNVNQDHRICSVAVQKGVVDQIEHLGRSYAAADTSNYGVAHYGDIIYTKSPTGDFPYGIIKQSQMNENVAISPLYGIYEPVCYELGYILHTYFGYAVNCSNYLLPIVQKGAKNTINITNDILVSNRLYLPMNHEEQMALAKIFIVADKEIDLIRKDLEQEKHKKKALMQLLLTGIVRV